VDARGSTWDFVTQSQQIVTLWAAAKHGLLFTAAYAGVANGGK
jgi:hypothetical protein